MNTFKLSLPTYQDLHEGVYYPLDVCARATDYAFLTGCGGSFDHYGWYWLKADNSSVNSVSTTGGISSENKGRRCGGIRPSIYVASLLPSSKKIISFGEYPQFYDYSDNEEIESAFQRNQLSPTGKFYSLDSCHWNDVDSPFQLRRFPEYKYNNKKYIRLVGDFNSDGAILNNGERVVENNPYWIKVEPILWIPDYDHHLLLSKYVLLSGIRYHSDIFYDSFDNTEMNNYLSKYMTQEISPDAYQSTVIDHHPNLQQFIYRKLPRK